jgi:hypothetical protein
MIQKNGGRIFFHPAIRYAEAARIAREQGGRLARSREGLWSIEELPVPRPARRDFNPVIVPCAAR